MDDIINSCDLYERIKKMSVVNKNSASNTKIVMAVVKLDNNRRKNVIAKIFPNIVGLSSDYTYNQLVQILNFVHDKLSSHISGVQGLIYEMATYKIVTEAILNQKYSQNFVRCIGSGYCNYDILGPNLGRELAESYGIIRTVTLEKIKDYFKPLRAGIIFTEKIGSEDSSVITFAEFVESESLYKKEVIFQIVHALSVMGHFRIQHNDLHAGNVLVERLNEEKSFIYYSNTGESYTIRTKYIPYIFDWDFAFVENLGPNRKLINSNFCTSTNICNTFDPYFDLYTLFCTANLDEITYLSDLYDSININEDGDEFVFSKKSKIRVFMLLMKQQYPHEFYNESNYNILVLNDRNKIRELLQEEKIISVDKSLKGDVLIYNKKTGYLKEGIFLTGIEHKNIREKGINIADDVYKFTPDILITCLDSENYKKLFKENFLSVIVKISPTDILDYSAILEKFKGFDCRPTEYLPNMPTPIDLLNSRFSDLISTENDLKTITDIFYFPNYEAQINPVKNIYNFSRTEQDDIKTSGYVLPDIKEYREEEDEADFDIFEIKEPSHTDNKNDEPLGKPQEPQGVNLWKFPELQKPSSYSKPPPPFKFDPSKVIISQNPPPFPRVSPKKAKNLVSIDLFDDNKYPAKSKSKSYKPYKPSSRAIQENDVRKTPDSGYDIVEYNPDEAVFVLDEDQHFSVNT